MLKKILCDINWASQHFLTMEFYRRICNRYYWKRIKPGTVSFLERIFWVIISVFFFSFSSPFYSASDPANLVNNKFNYKIRKYYILLISFYKKYISQIYKVSNFISLEHQHQPSYYKNTNRYILTLKSSFLI